MLGIIKRIQNVFSAEERRLILSSLEDKGKKKPKGWKKIHSEICGPNESEFDVEPLLDQLHEKHKSKFNFAIDIVSNPDSESSLDRGQFRVRYSYGLLNARKGEPLIKDNTREFCAELVRSKKIFRREDINQMSFRGSNPIAKKNYSIFKLRGHWNCRHSWVREVFIIERDPSETENNPIVDKKTLMSNLKKAVAAFKKEFAGDITEETLVQLNEELLTEQVFVDIKIEDNILRIDGALEVGAAVAWVDESGEISEVPDGQLTDAEGGNLITVVGGVITEIEVVEEAAEESEAEAELAEAKTELSIDERFATQKTEIADMVETQIAAAFEKLTAELSSRFAKVDELKKEVENTPAFSADKTKNSHKTELKKTKNGKSNIAARLAGGFNRPE